jgi:RNA-splicing ligase RtcB
MTRERYSSWTEWFRGKIMAQRQKGISKSAHLVARTQGRIRMIEYEGKYTTAKVMGTEIDEACATQIVEFINHPAFTNPSVIMPDFHYGAGCVIGFTMPLPDKVVPNTVGVDMNCAVTAYNLGRVNVDMLDLVAIDRAIRDRIPFGFGVHDFAYKMKKVFPFDAAYRTSVKFWRKFNHKFGTNWQPIVYDYAWFERKCESIGMSVDRAVKSLGTLGGGNHFIELGTFNSDLWATVHSGSRQLGLKMCEYWQKRPAERKNEEMRKEYQKRLQYIKENYESTEISRRIKKLRAELGMDNKMAKSLDYIGGGDMYGYLTDMIFAQHYAHVNRYLMIGAICNILEKWPLTGDFIETVHNYISFDDLIIRKGAVSAHKGERLLIPFNMEDGILICEGKGNPEWNYSAPHGAGRAVKRSEAKEKFSSKDTMKRMKDNDIYTTVVPSDEVKEAYKDPEVIERAIGPTVEVIGRIKPIMNLKDEEKR